MLNDSRYGRYSKSMLLRSFGRHSENSNFMTEFLSLERPHAITATSTKDIYRLLAADKIGMSGYTLWLELTHFCFFIQRLMREAQVGWF